MLLALPHIDNDCVASAGVTGVEPGLFAGVAELGSFDFEKSRSSACVIIDKERSCST